MNEKLENRLNSARELLSVSIDSVKVNKLRSILTLTGIAIGVFSIIAVMTAIGVLQQSIESGLNQLGANTFQIQKYDGGINNNDRDRVKRRDITYEQAKVVAEKSTLARYIGLEAWSFGDKLKSRFEETRPDVQIAGGDYAFFPNNSYNIEFGRSITDEDVRLERQIVVLGKDVAEKLFPNTDPLGELIVYKGQKFAVSGVMEARGSNFGQSQDNLIVIPLTAFFKIHGSNVPDLHITVMAPSADLMEATMDECFGLLRTARGLEPGEENDFSVFSNDSMVESFNQFTGAFKLAAAAISFIALLAAGIGIMNIMLVSVTERTREIGIRKAVGATRPNIMFQFVSEAIIICQIGGVAGIFLGAIAGNMVSLLMDVPAYFPYLWAFIGVVICSLVGIVFGSYPAYKAANLDPISALRYE